MPITLKQEQEKFVLDKLQQAKYKNADELFEISFELLEKMSRKSKNLFDSKKKF